MSGWNGSGVFTFPYNFEQDAANGINIRADRMDSQFFIISTNGFANTLTRDGQGIATANLPMNSFKHTGAGDGSSSGDYATYNQAAILALGNTFAGANTFSGTTTFTLAPVFTDQSGSRTALGLGTAATHNTGTSGANVPLLNGGNTWSGANDFQGTFQLDDNFIFLGNNILSVTGSAPSLVLAASPTISNPTVTGTLAAAAITGTTGVFSGNVTTNGTNLLGTNGSGARTVSTSGPSGTPADGDIWVQRVP